MQGYFFYSFVSHSNMTAVISYHRVAIVLICYALSGYGLTLMGMLVWFAITDLYNGNVQLAGLFFPVWIYAWACHAMMSFAWVFNRKVARFWSVTGAVAGLGSLLYFPSIAIINSPSSLAKTGVFFIFETAFVLPCVVLGIFLVFFHIGSFAKPSVPDANG